MHVANPTERGGCTNGHALHTGSNAGMTLGWQDCANDHRCLHTPSHVGVLGDPHDLLLEAIPLRQAL
eukprot:15016440-Alexandrium_andersonii.AAC.1